MTSLIVLAGVAGLLVGSFLNVVAHRLPLGQSLVSPRSRCPECGAPVRAYDNVPVLSWLVLKGRCRHCSTSISPQYPIVELATGALYAAVALAAGRRARTSRSACCSSPRSSRSRSSTSSTGSSRT